MNQHYQYEINRLEAEQSKLALRIRWIRDHADKIPEGFEGAFSYENRFDFDRLSHDKIITLLKAFGGKWEKSLSSGATDRVDYCREINGVIVRCWAGELPPNCRVVEVDEVVPAQPETTRKIRKLICKETIDASQSV